MVLLQNLKGGEVHEPTGEDRGEGVREVSATCDRDGVAEADGSSRVGLRRRHATASCACLSSYRW